MSKELVDELKTSIRHAEYLLAEAAERFVGGELSLNQLRKKCERVQEARKVWAAANECEQSRLT